MPCPERDVDVDVDVDVGVDVGVGVALRREPKIEGETDRKAFVVHGYDIHTTSIHLP